MNEFKRKRVTMKLKTPNPLFQKWLTEWRDQARKESSKMEFCFNIALQSLKRYPLPLERGKDCQILKGFGKKLCEMIDNRLQTHQLNMIKNVNYVDARKSQYFDGIDEAASKKSKPIQDNSFSKRKGSCSKEYFPEEGSGAYAILVTLFIESLEPICAEFLTKQELIRKGQHLSRTSFTKPDPGSRYTAWSSMKTLVTKKLVIRKSNPPKFSLTNEGLALSKKLFDQRKNTFGSSFQTKETIIKNGKNQETCIDLLENTDSSSAYSLSSTSEISTDNGKSSSIISDKNSVLSLEDKTLSFGKGLTNSEVFTESSNLYSANTVHSDWISTNKTIQKHMSNSSAASSTYSLTQEECFKLLPNSFDIILYVDTCETSGSKALIQDDPILAELKRTEVAYEVKKLKIGDYIWICRDRTSKKELVLPYIIERKRMDDFGHSIKDGRYYEQKFRLKKCGVQNVIYLIERFGSNQHVGLPITTLYQAATNTAIQDGFCVKFTESIRHTARYLINLSAILNRVFKTKTLVSCSKENISDISLEDSCISVMTFQEFNHSSSKNKPTKVSDLFVKMLIQIKGMSVDRALAIVDQYPTPALLKKAYDENPGGKGEKLLASIQFGDCNKNIGPLLSKIVHQLFTLESFN
ncbi:crossover junction endonuclease MUS81 [Anoplophora glabripennis]|nr:crossover junction endonuclease MUS81 [Anoplophora glabripennis]